MPATRVIRLRHVGVAAPNFQEAVTFYTDAWGLTKTDSDSGIAFFAAEGSPEQYILRIRQADEKRIDLLAFGVESAESVDALAQQLASEGVRFVSEPGPLQTPGGGYGFRFFDPDGRVIEVSSDVAERPYRVLEEREAIPVKLSHVVLSSPNIDSTIAFYREKLGFKLSDWIENMMCFMRCTTDEHNLAIFRSNNAALNHVAFEFRGIDEFMRATGRVLKQGGIMRSGPGRHLIGDNTYSYIWDPNGNVSEITTNMEQILDDETWTPRRVTREESGDQWGTAKTADKVPENALLPETGHWVAPPI
jgi:catechol 2,3-dioxygenase-like lactoylglutathione lyase family enzyme